MGRLDRDKHSSLLQNYGRKSFIILAPGARHIKLFTVVTVKHIFVNWKPQESYCNLKCCRSQFMTKTFVIMKNVFKQLTVKNLYNGKEATVNRALDGSTYPG